MLSEQEIAAGYVAACHTYPESDLHLEIPPTSILSVDGTISTKRGEDLEDIFASYGTEVEPLTRSIYIELPPPTLEDNISDLERLKRGLSPIGFPASVFSFPAVQRARLQSA